MDELRNFSSSWNYFGNNYCADILLLLYCSALLLFNRSESLLEFRSNISEYSDVLFQYNRISLNFRFTRSKELLFFFFFLNRINSPSTRDILVLESFWFSILSS